MTPDYLMELADKVDTEQLWRRAGMDIVNMPPDERWRLDAGVALRRHASHIKLMHELLGTGRSLLLTPLSLNGADIRTMPTPAEITKRTHQKKNPASGAG